MFKNWKKVDIGFWKPGSDAQYIIFCFYSQIFSSMYIDITVQISWENIIIFPADNLMPYCVP